MAIPSDAGSARQPVEAIDESSSSASRKGRGWANWTPRRAGVFGQFQYLSPPVRASTEAKRKALEAAYTEIVTDDLPEWNQNPGLLNWLASL